MLLCHFIYPASIYQVPSDGLSLGSSLGLALLASPALASSGNDQCSPHPGPILPQLLSHRSLDILVSKCELHCGLLHAHSHAGAPLETRLLTLLPSSSDDGEEKKRCSPVFEFSLPPCALTRRVCTLSVCLPHCAALPRCCLLWLALLWPASQAFSSVVLLIIIILNTLLLPFPPTQHNSISLPS